MPYCGFTHGAWYRWQEWGGPGIRSLPVICMAARARAAISTFEWRKSLEWLQRAAVRHRPYVSVLRQEYSPPWWKTPALCQHMSD
eukprot:5276287-Pyramimonas_sp.AAC.1